MKLLLTSLTLVLMITNIFSQTEEHIQIPSTNVFMIMPQNFIVSESYKGFQHPEDPYTMLMVTEMPTPYHEISKGFSDDAMSPRGMTLIKKEDKRIGIDNGMYIEMLQEANGVVFKKAILVFGDDDKTTFINGMCLQEDDSTFTSIANAVYTAYVDNEITVDARAELDFTVDEEGIDLQFKSVIGNGMLFNRDGKMPTESADQLNIIIDKSYAEVETGDTKQFCLSRLAQFPGNYVYNEEAGITNFQIDGLDGTSLRAVSEEGEAIRQVILFIPEGGYYIYAALYDEGGKLAEKDADILLKTFKRK